MSEQLTAFVHWFDGTRHQYSAFFRTIAKGQPAVPETYAEERIKTLYELLDKNIYPWMWDHENYTRDMIGTFYPEDIENIKAIKRLGL